MRIFNQHRIHEIPIGKEGGNRYLPWVVGLLVFLLTLVFVCATTLGGALGRWQGRSSDKITIEIPASDILSAHKAMPGAPIQQPETDAITTIVQQVTSVLQGTPGLCDIEVVDNKRLLSLLAPWIGQAETLQGVLLPVLIDAKITPDPSGVGVLDIEDLRHRLREINAGIRIEPHVQWHHMLMSLSHTIKAVSYIVIAFIVGAICVVITLITNASLATHHSVIDVLRLMGAGKQYIAKNFQWQVFKCCLKGGVIGTILALPIIYAVSLLTEDFGIPELFRGGLASEILVIVMACPFFVAALCMIVSRLAVYRALHRMDS
ncbi:MAG: hypothetical protein NTX76_04655 [Alphaproteobacteria bacterium]|nr:hypothetical protein [Alphaproteobacteria bacterium]